MVRQLLFEMRGTIIRGMRPYAGNEHVDRHLRKMCGENTLDGLFQCIEDLSDEMAEILRGDEDRRDDHLEEAIYTFLLENYTNANLSLVELVAPLGLSERFLYDFIRERFNSTFAKLLEALRITKACSLLRDGEASIKDVSALVEFFGQQPKEAFTFFHPHGFNEKAIAHVVKNRAFLTFVVWHDKELVGYFFLRCFFNGKGYRGRMVDNRWNNKGIGKLMSLAVNHIALTLGIRMFSSISPENYASLASVKATCDMKVIKTLENGYFYIEILPQKTHPS